MEVLLFFLKLYVLGIPAIGCILSILIHNDKFLKVLLDDQQKLLDAAANEQFSDEEKMLLDISNFKLEDHLGILILDISFRSWFSLVYIIKIFIKSKKV